MSDLKDGDRVQAIKELPPIKSGTKGTVDDSSGIALIVKWDGDSSPGRLTPRDGVKRITANAEMAFAASSAAGAKKIGAKAAAKKPAATKKPQIVWGTAKITRAAGPSAAHTKLSTEIAGEVVILFDDAIVDLQTNGPLAGVWAGTLVFRFAQPVDADTKLIVRVRGNVAKSKASAGLVTLILDGEAHAKAYPFGRQKEGNYIWSLDQTLRKGAQTHSLTLLIAAERRTTDDFIRLVVDSIDIATR